MEGARSEGEEESKRNVKEKQKEGGDRNEGRVGRFVHERETWKDTLIAGREEKEGREGGQREDGRKEQGRRDEDSNEPFNQVRAALVLGASK